MCNHEPHINCPSSGQHSEMDGNTWVIEKTTVYHQKCELNEIMCTNIWNKSIWTYHDVKEGKKHMMKQFSLMHLKPYLKKYFAPRLWKRFRN